MAQLHFQIENQWISRTDNFKVVGKSKNYLYAEFSFLTDEWEGTATALFHSKLLDKPKEMVIGQDSICQVPWEVLDTEEEGEFFVSVFCGDLVTANKSRVHVHESGYSDDSESSEPPTPSVYAQIIERMDGIEDAVEDATERTETAAEKAEAAVGHYPRIVNEYWYVWDVENEEFVNTGIKAEAEDGTSATVTIESIPNGHRVIITDATGEHAFDVPDGYNGRGILSVSKTGSEGDVDIYTMTFTSGEPFVYYVTNGISSTITSHDIANGHRLVITDKTGTHTVDVMNGARGDTGNGIYSVVKSAEYQNVDYYTITYTNGTKTTFPVTNGVSITVNVEEVTGGHNITLNDVNGSQTFFVPDGNVGTLPVHICSGSEYDHTTGVPTIQDPVRDAFYLVPSDDPQTSDMFREWIYTDDHWEVFGGAKVDLSGYVKNTDYATTGKGGVVKVSSTNGLYIDSSTGNIRTSPATTTTIKTGTHNYQPIVPNYQHASVFYGLAKAAGDTTQSRSSNAVGTYTANAKSQIAQMLDVIPRSTIASEYNTSTTYDVGDYVTRLGPLYRCTTAITTPESWDSTHWTLVTVSSELENLGITVDSSMSDSSTNPVQNKVIKEALDTKVSAQTGKGLSTNDYTNVDKTKLDGIETGANKTVVDDALDSESTNPVQNAVVTEALDGKADISDLAPAYSTSGTYAVGDYVTYTGNVYRCTTAITTAEAWTAAHWTQIAIGDELSSTKADLSQLSGNILYPIEGSEGRPAGYVDIDTGVAWESGGLDDTTGQETSNDNFIRSADFIAFDPNISKIHLAYASDNITAKIVWYDSNYARSGASGAIDSIVPYDFDNPPAANRVYWKFALRYKAGSGLSPDATLQTLLKIQYYDAGEPGTQTDRKEEIETVLSEYGECILTKGDYYVTGVSMPVGSKIRGVGEETNLYLMASVTNGSAITPNGNNTISDMRILRENGYSTKPSSATAGTDFGITCADNVNIIRITNCDFEGFGGAGVYGYGSSSNDCMSAFIDNCRFRYCTIGIWFYGGMEFNSVSNCICNSCYYGVENQAGNNLFTNCHFDKNTIGWYQYGIGVTPANLGHGSAVGCTFNHNTSYAVFLQGGSNGFVFSSCQLWYGEIMLRALPGILFDACEIGGVTAPITFYGSGSKGHRFNGCSFNVQPTISLQSSATTDAYIVNDCYLFDGTAVTFAV